MGWSSLSLEMAASAVPSLGLGCSLLVFQGLSSTKVLGWPEVTCFAPLWLSTLYLLLVAVGQTYVVLDHPCALLFYMAYKAGSLDGKHSEVGQTSCWCDHN